MTDHRSLAASPVRATLLALLALVACAGASNAATPARRALVVEAGLGPPRAFSPAWLGMNGNNTQAGPSWADASLQDALRRLGPGTLRYPGGTIANYWRWRAGWFEPNGPWPGEVDWSGRTLTRFDNGLGVFADAQRATGALPVFVVNMLTVDGRLSVPSDGGRMRRDQVAFLRSAASLGLPIRRVELGNEFYLSGGDHGPHGSDYTTRFPTARSYAEQAVAWAKDVRAAFPRVRVAAVGADASGGEFSARRETWNAAVLRHAGASVDALTVHVYVSARDPLLPPQTVLASAYQEVRDLRRETTAPVAAAGKRVWVTEFNLADRTDSLTFAGTWMHGLFNLTLAVGMLEDLAVELVHVHNVVGDALAGALFDGVDGFRRPSPATQPLARTAMGTTLGVLAAAARNATSVQKLTFREAPVLASGVPALHGAAFGGSTPREVVVVNNGPQALTLDVDTVLPGAVAWRQWSAALATRVTGPAAVTLTSGSSRDGRVVLRAHSVLRLSS